MIEQLHCTVFNCKTVPWTEQTGGQGTRQKLKLLSLTKPQHNFLSHLQVV